LAAVTAGGGIYTSVNSGATWTQTSATNWNWTSISSSSDGTKLAAVAAGCGIFTSTNSGATWTQTSAPSADWTSIASSSDGNKLVAAVHEGGIYTWLAPIYPVLISPVSNIKVVVPNATNMIPGQDYQLQITHDLNNWTNYGSVFTATNATWKSSNSWEVANTNRMFFRLQMLP
jgi:hypothetical protein